MSDLEAKPSTSSSTEPVRVVGPRPPPSFGQIGAVIGIVLIHVGTIVAFTRDFTWKLVALAAATYFVRMFAITGVYHRYFSHRSYKTSRFFQLVLAFLGTTATQKGPLWWASTHRVHHRFSDTERDVHSPMQFGFWQSHMGWWLGREHEHTDFDKIPDFASFPELRWLDRNHAVGPAVMGTALYLIGGLDAFLWGYVVSTCVLMHATFTINSLAHIFGSRRYATTDTSRNNFWLALITLGEGWHNNHHHYMNSVNQGFFWWEIDVSYYALRGMSAVGLVWDLRKPSPQVLKRNLLKEVGEQSPLLLKQAAARAAKQKPELHVPLDMQPDAPPPGIG
ncbi:acyl-CoA desaturase [Chondromyces apiculatus]|uniref:Fatty acid desaturase n=1 Tax=Chondromyces apiculatus DSM 436 TaxID=1192034 RepID=A0A017T6M7_9BACT|nr:acyl-CoA desaturase [Chondromyces apiculatus]EYF04918.1 Fatty acid desaturase [Chondromyces apiculatus DSM 436]